MSRRLTALVIGTAAYAGSSKHKNPAASPTMWRLRLTPLDRAHEGEVEAKHSSLPLYRVRVQLT